MSEYSFKFSPSALQCFQDYLDCESNYERFFGHTEEPSLTYEEYERQKFCELIDRINRVPFESEAADKGSCLNEVVDCIVLGVRSTRDDIVIRSIRADNCVEAVKGQRKFYFDLGFCKELAEYFKRSLCQLYTEASIDTKFGKVLLYGYPDYVREDMVYDLKTTSKYEFGKYSKYWQQHVYPYTLTESGKCNGIKAFEFTAFQLKGGNSRQPLISGDKYPEVYVYDHQRSARMLRGICEQFGEFLLHNQSLIKDEKIFGGERKAEGVPSIAPIA